MLLVIRSRFPRIANVLSFVSGMIFLAIGIAAGASPTILILGGGSSVLLSAVRYVGKRHPRLVAGRGTAAIQYFGLQEQRRPRSPYLSRRDAVPRPPRH